jgi:hypothetical protein
MRTQTSLFIEAKEVIVSRLTAQKKVWQINELRQIVFTVCKQYDVDPYRMLRRINVA